MKKPRRNQNSTHRSKSKKIACNSAGRRRESSKHSISSKQVFTKMVTIASLIDRGYRFFCYCQENGYIPSGEGIWRVIKEAVSALA
ncbi:hypothetical protein U0Y97_10945 [Enterobacter chuandaensis]|uniref:hypothetical protein n=1 Tax=Enterobacter chuandaensis TaxID=2497875 RepID=UPI0039C1BC3E